MLRFSVVPCVVVVVVPVLIMVVMRAMIELFRSSETGYHHRGRFRGLPPYRRRMPRAGWRGRRDPGPLPPVTASPGDQSVQDPWEEESGDDTESWRADGGERVCSNELCCHANRPEARFCARCGTRLTD